MKSKHTLSTGQKRVRSGFNPSKDSAVDQIKAKAAELIDLCISSGQDDRLTAIACTQLESAAMFAVKSATAEKYAEEVEIEEYNGPNDW